MFHVCRLPAYIEGFRTCAVYSLQVPVGAQVPVIGNVSVTRGVLEEFCKEE